MPTACASSTARPERPSGLKAARIPEAKGRRSWYKVTFSSLHARWGGTQTTSDLFDLIEVRKPAATEGHASSAPARRNSQRKKADQGVGCGPGCGPGGSAPPMARTCKCSVLSERL